MNRKIDWNDRSMMVAMSEWVSEAQDINFFMKIIVEIQKQMINYQIYMDGIKISAKNGKELETLIHEVRIYIQGIRMEFGIEKNMLFLL